MKDFTTTVKLAANDDSPMVMALHCSGHDRSEWRPLMELLAPDVALFACDLIGYGKFEGRVDTALTLAKEADHAMAQLPAHARRFHLVGHSYGAAVALEIAMRYPTQVLSLTLHEPVRFSLLKHFPHHHPSTSTVFHVGGRIMDLARSFRAHEAAAFFVDFWSGYGTWERLPENWKERLRGRMQKIALEYEAIFQDEALPAAYRAIACPVTVTTGSHSPDATKKVSEIICNLLPQAFPMRIEGAGHMAPLTHMGAFAAQLPANLLAAGPRARAAYAA